MSRVRPEYKLSFRGGLNTDADKFALAPDETPDCQNVVFDEDGGVSCRAPFVNLSGRISLLKGDILRWIRPMRAASGTVNLYGGAGTDLWHSDDDGATWTELAYTTTSAVQWGDFCYAIDRNGCRKFRGTTLETTFATTETWSEYASPSTYVAQGDVGTAHLGYLFIGGFANGGGEYGKEARLRWSHPNNPEAWHEDDYIDLLNGGGAIKRLVSNGDHLLIFQETKIHALFGYDSDSWQLVEVSPTLGVLEQHHVTQTELGVFFYVMGMGVYLISGDSKPVELSRKVRERFRDSSDIGGVSQEVYVGWADDRLWVCSRDYGMYIYDPRVGEGVWTYFHAEGQEADGHDVIVNVVDYPNTSGARIIRGFDPRGASFTIIADAADGSALQDGPWVSNSTSENVEAYVRTQWIHGGTPTLKKQWRRPDVIAKKRYNDYTLTLKTYRDYDDATLVRTKTVTVDGTASSDDDGSSIVRGGSHGPSKAIAVEITGQAGQPWGVDAIVFKFIPRRLR